MASQERIRYQTIGVSIELMSEVARRHALTRNGKEMSLSAGTRSGKHAVQIGCSNVGRYQRLYDRINNSSKPRTMHQRSALFIYIQLASFSLQFKTHIIATCRHGAPACAPDTCWFLARCKSVTYLLNCGLTYTYLLTITYWLTDLKGRYIRVGRTGRVCSVYTGHYTVTVEITY